MNRNVYRLCLVLVIGIAVVFGIWYYRFVQNQEIAPKDGTFVWSEMAGSEDV